MKIRQSRGKAFSEAAFTLIELVLVVVVVAMLAALHSNYFSRLRERTYVAIDQNNLRQILEASSIYAFENDDRLAHPTWGGDLTGPDGWAYLTSQRSRPVPGALSFTPQSCAGRDVNSANFTNQLAFFGAGQVTQYLPEVKSAWCPKDVATRGSGRLKGLWLSRPVKVTSYTWNATIGGYVGSGPDVLAEGTTYKLGQFLPSDWQMWEGNENSSFNFNDAASNPESVQESPSFRHLNLNSWWTFAQPPARNVGGGVMVGRFGGSAEMISWRHAYDLFVGRAEPPNEILNGPRYRW